MQPHANSGATLATRLAFLSLLVMLAFIHVFVTFRGLRSSQGMDQAQIARELARGNGYSTKFIRPYAWRQMIDAGKAPSPALMPDTAQPPLAPVLYAPLFHLLEKWSVFDPDTDSRVFLLDRVIASIGAILYLLTIAITHGTTRRLFDSQIATITSLVLALGQPFWDIAVSGSPRVIVMFLSAIAFRLMVGAMLRKESERSATLPLLGVGIVSMLLVMTHWMAAWLVVGLLLWAVLLLPRKMTAFLLIGLPPLLALTAWVMRNAAVSGDYLGAMKPFLQSHLMPSGAEPLLRDFVSQNAGLDVGTLLRKGANNLTALMQNIWSHLGCLAPALLFFPALLHRFRRAEVAATARGLACVLAPVVIGLCMHGFPEQHLDDNDLLCALAPAMCGFGAAFLAVLWSRFNSPGGWLWSRWGFAVIAVLISALPLLVSLPYNLRIGLFFKGQLFHWPPYLPANLARVNKMVEKDELLFTDAPWSNAWYTDRASVWLPVSRNQFPMMTDEAAKHQMKVAGFIITPVSGSVKNSTSEILDGDYREWADLVLRGTLAAFRDSGIKPPSGFNYNATLPLVANPSKESGGLNISMAFYSDRVRW